MLVTVNTNYKAAELEYIMKNADIHTMCMVNGYRDSDYVQILYDLVPELHTLPRGRLHSDVFPNCATSYTSDRKSSAACTTTAELLDDRDRCTDDALLASESTG